MSANGSVRPGSAEMPQLFVLTKAHAIQLKMQNATEWNVVDNEAGYDLITGQPGADCG
jgi:hypothetical protein